MNNTDKTILTDEELDSVVNELKENVPEQIARQRELQDEGATLDPENEQTIDEKYITVHEDGSVKVDDAVFEPTLNETNLPIDEAIGDKLDEENIAALSDTITNEATNTMGLSDEDAGILLDVILRYRNGEKFPVYQELPAKIQAAVRDLARQVNAPASEWNRVSKIVLDEFIEDSKMDEAFIDLEKSMKEALEMPDFIDLYSEHIKDMMTTRTLEIAEKVQEENPEKADLLRNISAAFVRSYKLEGLMENFETNARTRKALRRDYGKVIKFCEEINFMNENTKFKMSDARGMVPALQKVLLMDDTGEEKFYGEDVDKFVTLWCKTVEPMNPNDIVEATYIYYGMKSIIMLQFTNEAKTDFAMELISNIKEVIYKIRAKEDEFNEANKR